eukprot:GHUV01038650.1.p1 GENE.GHUV01038650.1~~GHUV01038650.1.p1  ORF type:complete len:121 (+),score=8.84 GHUV01038650.1:228-590(+)
MHTIPRTCDSQEPSMHAMIEPQQGKRNTTHSHMLQHFVETVEPAAYWGVNRVNHKEGSMVGALSRTPCLPPTSTAFSNATPAIVQHYTSLLFYSPITMLCCSHISMLHFVGQGLPVRNEF